MRLFACLLAGVLLSTVSAAQEAPRALLIVLDGLRPDYVAPEIMPRLHALAQEGVFFEEHHAAYPTVTRVNATSIVTGAYPQQHGIMDNTVYFPEVDPERALSTGSRENLLRIQEVLGGKLITAPDLGSLLREAGLQFFVGSAGSSGSSYLLNHTGHGMIVHNEYVVPQEEEGRVLEAAGEAPPEGEPNAAQNARAVEAYLKLGLEATLSILWLSDPDHTGHDKGIGDPVTMESLRLVDAAVGRLLDGLDEQELRDSTNILITSDHGFSTCVEQGKPQELLEAFMKEQGKDPKDLVLSGHGIYLRKDKEELLPLLVQRLQETPWMGPLFMRGEGKNPQGHIAGTWSYDLVHLDHERAPDLVFSPNWSDDANSHGWAGTTYTPGVAGHGSASRWEIHNTLIAHGPRFKRATRSPVPSHNVDLAPTILHLLGLKAPNTMQGRVLKEALQGGPDFASVKVNISPLRQTLKPSPERLYDVVLQVSSIERKTYFDFAQVIARKP